MLTSCNKQLNLLRDCKSVNQQKTVLQADFPALRGFLNLDSNSNYYPLRVVQELIRVATANAMD